MDEAELCRVIPNVVLLDGAAHDLGSSIPIPDEEGLAGSVREEICRDVDLETAVRLAAGLAVHDAHVPLLEGYASRQSGLWHVRVERAGDGAMHFVGVFLESFRCFLLVLCLLLVVFDLLILFGIEVETVG